MNIRTFWITALKVLGIYFCYIELTLLSTISSFILIDIWLGIAILLFWIILGILNIYFLLFKTPLVVDKLQLDKGYTEEKIELKGKKSAVLSIAVIVFGGLILIDAIPAIINQISLFLRSKQMFVEYTGVGWLAYHFAKLIIGYLLLTKSNSVVKFILKKQCL
ncbi:hypothetical protein FACS189434_02100 [Bacteroidia bacterium]|nr:hypothetical protein FACS189434_02100 [Bacteroidia bacterium]